MATFNINRVVVLGNLTRDPELRALPSGANVCSLRIASNSSRRNPDTEEWEPRAHYFDVSVFGGQADVCAQYLVKGRPVAVDGRLDWREWESGEGGHREAVQIVADSVQFLSGAQRADGEEEPVGAGADLPF